MRMKHLSSTRRWVIEQCQALGFGRLTFRVKEGARDPAHRSLARHTVKLSGGEDRSRLAPAGEDFELCKEQAALLTTLAGLPDGTAVSIDVRHGLPFLVEFEQHHVAA